MERIPVFVPHIGLDTVSHLTNALEIGWLGMGATTKEFEQKIAEFLGLTDRYVVATNTGTSALHIALLTAGIGEEDEVITPSFNYVADHQAIRMTGAEVVMCDIREDNLGIDCEKAEELINEKTKAIIPLHFAGIPCDQDGVYKLAKKYGLRVIEDAMHSFGTSINGKKIGSYGDITCFSFDPVKIITSIDGGCVVVNSLDDVEKLHRYRFLGVDKETSERYKNKRAWEYDVLDEGFRYHLTNIMASVGVSQINKIDIFIHTRQEVCKAYNQAFSNIDGIRTPRTSFTDISPFIYSLRVLDGKREDLIKYLDERGIDVGIHFIPVHKHKAFSDCKRTDLSVTDAVTKEVLTIPLHSNMKKEHIDRVKEGIISFFSKS